LCKSQSVSQSDLAKTKAGIHSGILRYMTYRMPTGRPTSKQENTKYRELEKFGRISHPLTLIIIIIIIIIITIIITVIFL